MFPGRSPGGGGGGVVSGRERGPSSQEPQSEGPKGPGGLGSVFLGAPSQGLKALCPPGCGPSTPGHPLQGR